MRYLLFLVIALGIFSNSPSPDLTTVKSVDLERYSGKWYEIAQPV